MYEPNISSIWPSNGEPRPHDHRPSDISPSNFLDAGCGCGSGAAGGICGLGDGSGLVDYDDDFVTCRPDEEKKKKPNDRISV